MRLTALLVPSALIGVLGWMHRWTADDAFINYRVVDQILAGNGPVFNEGERVEAATSTLWLLLLTVVHGVLRFVSIEWIAVVLGLALTVAGVAAATLAGRQLAGEGPGTLLPLGALVFAALPPGWDYATSGLETGLSLGWLGGTFLALAVAWNGRRDWAAGRVLRLRRLDWIAVLAGLAPLIRPDMALFGLAFLGLVVALEPAVTVRRVVRLAIVAGALPVAYQVFRMGYFAALVPNTALAKEAGATWWDHGWHYIWDTFGTYWLVIPLVALAALAAWSAREGDRARRLFVVLPFAAALLHLVFLAKVGGDFMHGRLALPSIFALLLPVAAVRVDLAQTARLAAALVVVCWALVSAAELRPDYWNGKEPDEPSGVGDERWFYQRAAKEQHPITLEDYAEHAWAAWGKVAADDAERGRAVLWLPQESPAARLGSRRDLPDPAIIATMNVGMTGYAAGPDVRVVDLLGLGDPIASRFELEGRSHRTRAGHEKQMDAEWAIARFADPVPRWAPEDVERARSAMQCGDLRDVLEAVNEPLTVGRFLENLALAPRATSARWRRDPADAERDVCGGAE